MKVVSLASKRLENHSKLDTGGRDVRIGCNSSLELFQAHPKWEIPVNESEYIVNYKSLVVLSVICLSTNVIQADTPQYQSGDIVVSGASADEPFRKEFSLAAAKEYLTKGNRVWTEKHKCVSCHTNGVYMQLAPALGKLFGEEVRTHRDLFAEKITKLKTTPPSSISSGR